MKHAKVKSQVVVFLHPQLDASIHTKVHLLHDPNISSPECLLGAPLYNCSSTQVSNQQATQEKLSGWGQDGLLKFRASQHWRKTVLKSLGRKAGWAAVCILETADPLRFPTQQSPGFTDNSTKKRKYPMGGSSLGQQCQSRTAKLLRVDKKATVSQITTDYAQSMQKNMKWGLFSLSTISTAQPPWVSTHLMTAGSNWLMSRTGISPDQSTTGMWCSIIWTCSCTMLLCQCGQEAPNLVEYMPQKAYLIKCLAEENISRFFINNNLTWSWNWSHLQV